MEELAHIMKCKDERELIVMPIFYDVDPSDVRKHKRKFGEAIAKHEVKAGSWRKALVDLSNIAGWEPKNIANGHQSIVIKRIVDTILDILLSLNSVVDEDLVGMKARLQDLKTLLEIGSGGVRMVGIWGVGGGGNTTLANSICMEISHQFEGHYVVENIREESRKYGLKKLQESMISSVFKTKVEVHSIVEGKNLVKRMLCHSNVLILLDDVDDANQLEALAGSHNWFGSGSRIIITTRDEHLLSTHKVDEIYRIKLLSNEEAIQLFNKRAYNEKNPIKDYEILSLRVISYAAGLPLALKVLGSFLYDKDKRGWMSTLARLKDIPETKILEQLKLSYDGLKTVEKELFLDIACFFRGKSTKKTDDAMQILEACGFHPDIGITVLRQKALLDIVDGKFDMHDMVQEMGHYIIRGKHPDNPEKHSRVWKQEEINELCHGDATMVNNKIEAIMYYAYTYDHYEGARLCKIVSNMKKLRWLKLSTYHDKFTVGPNFLSNNLRYIYWKWYPASPFPENFHPMKLAILRLHDNLQKELWKGYKRLPHLKVLELVSMKKLLNTPDFDGLSCLQKFTIIGCEELEEIHSSIGNHRSLEYVKVSRCRKLKRFPTIVRMEKLKTLEINACEAILEFPEIQANMESLVNLSLERNGIGALPSSIGVHCTNLSSLHLVECLNLRSIELNFYALKHLKELKYGGYPRLKKMPLSLFKTMFTQLTRNLQKLNLDGCRFKDGEIPVDIGELSMLQELDLTSNDFTRLDFSLLQLTQLKLLKLDGCGRLVKLPELPSSIVILEACNCNSLTTVGDYYANCKWLCQVSKMRGGVVTDGNRLLQSMLQGNAAENHSMLLRLQGLEIAKGFTPLIRGSRCRLRLPDNWFSDFCGFLMCAVVIDDFDIIPPWISMKHMMSGIDYEDDVVWEESDIDGDKYTLVWYVPFASLRHTAWWDETYKHVLFSIGSTYNGCSYSIDDPILCSGFGVRLVARKSGSGPRETPTQEYEISHYAPNVDVLQDSTYALHIWFKSMFDNE